jgi:gamma-glutamyltranspeptidase / glutathione hydrolase
MKLGTSRRTSTVGWVLILGTLIGQLSSCSSPAQPAPHTQNQVACPKPPPAPVVVPPSPAKPLVTFPEGWAYPTRKIASVEGKHGVVTCTDRIASEIGVAVLRRGGNAIDAAVAVHFALAVVNPEAGNLGGGGFLVLRTKDGKNDALDFREKAPKKAHEKMFQDEKGNVTKASQQGYLSIGVPGSVDGMVELHKKYGTRPWKELLAPAIELAKGMVMHERLALSLKKHSKYLQNYKETGKIFVPGGHAPDVGERWQQVDLARTLERIAKQGRDGFYKGVTASLLASDIQKGKGWITVKDLENYHAVWRRPISFKYRNHEIISMPPPSSGGTTLAEMLQILEHVALAKEPWHSPRHLHFWIEANRRAFVDRNTYLGDPDFTPFHYEKLADPGYAKKRFSEINAEKASNSKDVKPGQGYPPTGKRASLRSIIDAEGNYTTHYSVVDGQGTSVSVTTTLNFLYGSGIVPKGTGVLMNNEMDDFAAKPGTANAFGLVQAKANAVASEKRMLSSMSPTIVINPAGKVKLVVGSPGGPTIITSVAQVISNVIDWNMPLAQAMAAPRLHHQHLPDLVFFEEHGLAPATQQALQKLGHHLKERKGFQGDVQAIEILDDGTLVGVADPRRGGAAVANLTPPALVHLAGAMFPESNGCQLSCAHEIPRFHPPKRAQGLADFVARSASRYGNNHRNPVIARQFLPWNHGSFGNGLTQTTLMHFHDRGWGFVVGGQCAA